MNETLKTVVVALSAAIIIIFVVCVIIAFAPSPVPQKGTIVSCSAYYRIVDIYKTPDGNRMTLENNITYDLDKLAVAAGKPYIGSYLSVRSLFPYYVNLTQLSENQSGMRDACMVI